MGLLWVFAWMNLTHYNTANFLSLILFKFFTHVLLRNLRGLSSSEFSNNNFAQFPNGCQLPIKILILLKNNQIDFT